MHIFKVNTLHIFLR